MNFQGRHIIIPSITTLEFDGKKDEKHRLTEQMNYLVNYSQHSKASGFIGVLHITPPCIYSQIENSKPLALIVKMKDCGLKITTESKTIKYLEKE